MNADLWSALGEITDTLKTTKPDLASINCGQVSKEVLKALKHVSPLSGSVDCPEPYHLNPCWVKVEAVLQSIDPVTIRCSYLNTAAIQALGMYLLGDAAWAIILPGLLPTTTWQSFKLMVEA